MQKENKTQKQFDGEEYFEEVALGNKESISKPWKEVMVENKKRLKKRYSGVFGKFLKWWDNHWFYIKNFHPIKEVKYFYQRGIRGYSDRDVWGFDYYLAGVIVGGVKILKRNIRRYGGYSENREWSNILSDIIFAFETQIKIGNGDLYVPPSNKKTRSKFQKELKALQCGSGIRYLTNNEYKRMQKGMRLFINNFNSLWD